MIKALSFCIVNQAQSADSLRRCVESIRKQGLSEYEILVYGAGNVDGGVKYFYKDEWNGAVDINKMRNLLCRQASKDFIVLMDVDVELAKDWYGKMKTADCFDIIGSCLIRKDDKKNDKGIINWIYEVFGLSSNERVVGWAYQVKLGNRTFPVALDNDEWTPKAYVSGALMVIRRSVWERVKFDESLPLGQEDDADFCLRASEIGFRCGVFPEAVAIYCPGPNSIFLRKYSTFGEASVLSTELQHTLNEGNSAYCNRDYGRAIQCFQKALEIAPENGVAWAKLGWAHHYQRNHDESIKAFDKALNLEPKNHYPLRGRGWAHLLTSNYQQALQDLSQALQYIQPDEKGPLQEVLRARGWVHVHQRNCDKALRDFKTVLEITGEAENEVLQDAYRGMAWSNYYKNCFEEALQYFDRAMEKIDPQNKAVLEEVQNGKQLASSRKKTALSPEKQEKSLRNPKKRGQIRKKTSGS